ncbi:hypothetical protein F5Y13DRAFT_175248 [Hypoxylon sp. FL1857]|nr:hypothetical protein F5Y13DRAFT_175248 [Hypoxylon sp. FL1857]
MTENSPEVLATANLTPVSPAPLHLSSPVVVPTLQDQADSLYAMPLSNGAPEPMPPTTAMDQFSNPANQDAVANTNHQDDAQSVNVGISHRPRAGIDEDGNEDGSAEHQERPASVGDEGNAKRREQQNGAAESQQDVSNSIASSLNSDTSESQRDHFEVTTSSHDVSSTIPAQDVHQPIPNSSPHEAQEPQEPQEQAVVAVQDDPDAAQPPTESSAEMSDLSSATNDDIDIQSLVDRIIGNASAVNDNPASSPQTPATASPVSLPPRPPMPEQPPQPALSHQPGPSSYATAVPSALPPPPGIYPAGAPGTALEARNHLPPPPPPPAASLNALPPFPVAHFDPTYLATTDAHQQSLGQSQSWEAFVQEERRYVSEAKWDRFPEGSRLFIGNLSSDRVSKKEVFDIFSKYGRLAQISLKQAYGFVQYHTLAEGQAAMEHLQGIEVRGRKIHLEFSRTQKKDGDGEKRGNRVKRENDRHDGVRGRRDDYRPGRQASPRRGGSHRQAPYDDGRGGYYDDYNARGRSRSPGYGRRDSGHYRRRSPSPYHHRPSEPDLGIPRRYGGDVPDVQFILIQEVEREFVSWVERAFIEQGLKVHVMFLHPHFPREAVVQRQVMEGVHAVVELDFRAQQTGTISLQVFNRSSGRDNVRYDQYRDLNPAIAAQLVGRAKSQAQPPTPSYAAHAQYPQGPQPAYLPPSYAGPAYPTTHGPPPPGNAGPPLDNATLQRILGSLPNQQGAPQGYPPGQPAGGAPIDVNALLASYGGANPAGVAGSNQPHNAGYMPGPANGAPGPPSGDHTQQVQNIMATLSQFRQ